MDLYVIWADKQGDISDHEWVEHMQSFFDLLVKDDRMQSYRITRCKLGFRSIADLPEWMIILEFRDLAQLDLAFGQVSADQGPMDQHHRSFNQFVAANIQHALFRDWPDQNISR